MENRTAILNFISQIRETEIAEIIQDIELYHKGYRIYYAIDTYDVISYFLPYTDKVFTQNETKNTYAHKAIAYEKFFTSVEDKQILILDEYRLELLMAKSRIEKQIKQLSNTNTNIHSLISDAIKILSSKTDASKYLQANFELVIVLLILSGNKDDASGNLFSFLNKKFTFTSPEYNEDHGITTIFSQVRKFSYSDTVYTKFVKEMASYLLGLDSDFKRYCYLENTYRDIEAIGTLVEANRNAQKTTFGKKAVFLYLSSAPIKSREIFSILSGIKLSNRVQCLPNVYKYKKFNFHRNIYQGFLFRILLEEYKTNKSQQLETLEMLKKVVIFIDQNPNSYKRKLLAQNDEIRIVFERIDILLEKYLGNIDNHLYLKVYDKYKQIYEVRGTKKLNFNSNIIKIIDAADRVLDEQKATFEDVNQLSVNAFTYNKAVALKKLLTSKNGNIQRINIQFGKDAIKNPFHQLPYLFFIDSALDRSLKDNLYQLFDIISEVKHTQQLEVDRLVPHLKFIISNIADKRYGISSLAIDLIIVSFMNLLTLPVSDNKQRRGEKFEFADNELEIIEILRKQRVLIKNSAISAAREQVDSKIVIKARPVNEVHDIEYFLIWLLRRNSKFDEGIKLGERLIDEGLNDVRIYHGLGLCYISQVYSVYRNYFIKQTFDNITANKGALKLMNASIKNLIKAESMYDRMLEGSPNGPYLNKLIVKNLMAIYNSIADVLLQKSIIQKNISFLKRSRKYIEKLKAQSRRYNFKYEDYPTFHVTEAEIEYSEAAYYYYIKNNCQNALEKILYAEKRFEQTINVRFIMSEHSQRIWNDIQDLKQKIKAMM